MTIMTLTSSPSTLANAKDLDAKQHARAEAIAKELTDFEQRMTCADRASTSDVGRRGSGMFLLMIHLGYRNEIMVRISKSFQIYKPINVYIYIYNFIYSFDII